MTLGPVILDLESTSLSAEERQLLLHPAVGGVILFSRNITDYQQLQVLVADIRSVRGELLVCVDQEGGRVQRCKEGFTRLPPMQVFHGLWEEDPTAALQLARDCGWLLASEILAVGIDFSFAPVLDVDDSFCSVIGDRAFSSDPQRVSELAGAFIDGAHEAGMAVTGKHFPGHGSVRGDSHLELPTDSRRFDEVEARDLIPFVQLQPRLDAVMPAHIVFSAVDTEPVGFSARWLREILRQQLGFTGVVFSDDLNMEGASVAGSYVNRARQALQAGCDLVLVCNNRPGAEDVLQNLEPDLYQCQTGDRDSMRARQRPQADELRCSERWQNTSSRLQQLQAAKS
ncbi:beta-N-acetylhexosaminidase [Pseudomaricurvus sp. HS19]|uniref:beta-N-acetylhexosaminidase n=1 Tax=Pseudomaricurvus sp. HS19 TaxID=2692626 RepID=UPI001369F058|nr:beta-N-acetylhexosaminidase [Pseudomaricurvus sp. HS19]MYM62129.1 beta-N-acetylhexosaminidase [Pseudomaricurvus sp. HS19]